MARQKICFSTYTHRNMGRRRRREVLRISSKKQQRILWKFKQSPALFFFLPSSIPISPINADSPCALEFFLGASKPRAFQKRGERTVPTYSFTTNRLKSRSLFLFWYVRLRRSKLFLDFLLILLKEVSSINTVCSCHEICQRFIVNESFEVLTYLHLDVLCIT